MLNNRYHWEAAVHGVAQRWKLDIWRMTPEDQVTLKDSLSVIVAVGSE